MHIFCYDCISSSVKLTTVIVCGLFGHTKKFSDLLSS